MSPLKNRGGSARDILNRGSRQEQRGGAAEAARGEERPQAPVRAATPEATIGGRARRGGSRGAQGSGKTDGAPAAARKAAPARREGAKKRITVDLPRDEHKFLRDFAYDADSDGMSVVRALLQEMRGDEDLAERVLDRLAGK